MSFILHGHISPIITMSENVAIYSHALGDGGLHPANPQYDSEYARRWPNVQGAVKQSSSGAWLGGECVRSRKGVAAWGVVLWIFFSVSLPC